MMFQDVKGVFADDSGLVSSMEMTIGVVLSFILAIFAVLIIAYAVMGMAVNSAVITAARAGAMYNFPSETNNASTAAQQVLQEEVFSSTTSNPVQTSCSQMQVTPPSKPDGKFSVLAYCTVKLGNFLGKPIETSWTVHASVPTGPESTTS